MEYKKTFKYKVVLSFIIIPIGFLAGWSNEPSGGTAGLFVLMLIIYLIMKKRKPPLWIYSGITSVAAGLAVLVLAPGYKVKALQMHGASNLLNYSISNLGQNSKHVFQVSWDSLWPLFFIIAVASTILLKYANKSCKTFKKKKNKKKDFIFPHSKPTAIFYFVCAVAAIAIYIISPEFEPRYLFSAAVFLIISIGNVFSEIFKYINVKEKTRIFAAGLLITVCCVSIGVDAISEYHICSYNNDVKIRIEEDIKSQIKEAKNDVVLKGEYQFINGGQFNIYRKDVFNLHYLFGGPNKDYALTNRLLAATFGAETFENEATLSYINAQ